MSTEAKIVRGLKLYLKEVHRVQGEIEWASLEDTNIPDPDSGCDTCGYGREGISFDIRYHVKGSNSYPSSVEVYGDPLSFFPELYEYIERAN